MRQRLYFKNDKLVIETKKGVMSDYINEVIIEGSLEVSAEDAAKIFAMFNKRDVVIPCTLINIFMHPEKGCKLYTPDEIVKSNIEELEGEKNKLVERCKELLEERNKLKEKIAEFNSSRRWFERKIEC